MTMMITNDHEWVAEAEQTGFLQGLFSSSTKTKQRVWIVQTSSLSLSQIPHWFWLKESCWLSKWHFKETDDLGDVKDSLFSFELLILCFRSSRSDYVMIQKIKKKKKKTGTNEHINKTTSKTELLQERWTEMMNTQDETM